MAIAKLGMTTGNLGREGVVVNALRDVEAMRVKMAELTELPRRALR